MTVGNEAQAEYWVSAAGLKWIEHETALDTAMAGMLDLMLDAAELTGRERILDIGCGTGASTLGAAARVPEGSVLGVDISAPLLERARLRAREDGFRNVDFVLGDAQTDKLGPGGHDRLISRIGMSFFSDSLAALRNLASSLAPGGRMAFVCWAEVGLNPWFHLPKSAAEARLGKMPKSDPNAPGPTAFQDLNRVATLMRRAGLANVEAKPVEFSLTPPGGVQGAAAVASRVGPAARIMKGFAGNEEDARAIEADVSEAFAPYGSGPNGTAVVPAVVNLFTCRV